MPVLAIFFIIFFFTLITHGQILLNDGVYWDGWMLRGWQQRKDFAIMRTFYSQVGMPFFFYFHKLMAKLPNTIIWYKIISFMSLFFSSFLVYCLCQKSGFFLQNESLCIAILMLCYPGQQMTVEPSVIALYIFPLPLFFLACLLGLQGEMASGITQWAMRCSAIILFLISFNMNSLLVFYFGFIFFIIIHHIGNNGFNVFDIILYLQNHWYYLVLPFMFWVWKEKYTPRYGPYKAYNRINLKNFKSFKCLIGFFVIMCGIYYLAFPKHFVFFNPIIEMKSGLILLFGVFLLILGSLPYILIKQPFGVRGWATKNNALVALPTAIIVYGAFNLIFKTPIIPFAIYILIVFFIIYMNYIYLYLLALWIKHRSMLLNLNRIGLSKDISVFSVYDQHPIRGGVDNHPEYFTISLIYMFESLWGDVTRLGISEIIPRTTKFTPQEIIQEINNTTIDYALKSIDPNGKQALFIVKQGEQNSSVIKIAFSYLVFKFFSKNSMDRFLSGITIVELIPLKDVA